jgi:hypothetical protein
MQTHFRHAGYGTLVTLFSLVVLATSAVAQTGTAIPPCFELEDGKISPRPDTSSQNFIRFGTVDITPVNWVELKTDDYLYVTVRVTGRLCSPFWVFLSGKQEGPSPLVMGTRPSLPHPSGEIDRDFQQFVTFGVDPKDIQPGATAQLVSVKMRVVQYQTEKEYGVLEIPLRAAWRAPGNPTVRTFPEYECIDSMRLPPVVEPRTQCSNAFPLPKGSSTIDVNQDGICEAIVRDEVCDRTHGNTCYRLMSERDGAWQPLTYFYNRLTQHQSDSAYRSLSYIEHGPLSETTSLIEWHNGTYLRHQYLHNCSLVPK